MLSVLGVMSEMIGIGFTCTALIRQNKNHGGGPVWPLAVKLAAYVRGLLRRKQTIHVASFDGAMTADSAMSARMIVTGPAIPEDVSVEEQIRLLVRRIERVEDEARDDREQQHQAVKAMEQTFGTLRSEVRTHRNELRETISTLATGGIRSELAGLLWIGIGAALAGSATTLQNWPG